jgi:transposase
MVRMAKDLDQLANRLEDQAKELRGHLLGFIGHAADRVRDELERMDLQAQQDADQLRAIANWLRDRAPHLEQEQQDWIRRQRTWPT